MNNSSTAVMKETRSSGTGAKAFFAKMSRGLMLPIALLPIAGLFLGVGAGFENVIKQAMPEDATAEAIAQATFFFVVMKSIGDVVFGNLPTLFCLGIAVAYAHDSGVATFSALVGWIIFNATQSTMIWEAFDSEINITNFLAANSIIDTDSFGVWIGELGLTQGFIDTFKNFAMNAGVTSSVIATFLDNEIQNIDGITTITSNGLLSINQLLNSFNDSDLIQPFIASEKALIGEAISMTTAVTNGLFNILWWTDVPASVVGSNVGLRSMQTSVFGGITIGLFVAFLYNKFHDFQMPQVLGFFSGNKFVPIITFLTVPLWGFVFLMAWPAFGIGLDMFGRVLAGMPMGIDSFIFGVVERALVPFGLHHAFYSPLWYTAAGGTLIDPAAGESWFGNQTIWFAFQELGIPFSVLPGIGASHPEGWELFTEHVDGAPDGMWTIVHTYLDTASISQVDTYYMTAGMNPGSYMQGKFVIMMFGLPAAAAAMIMACKKENRQVAMSVIGAAGLTSFLTGITEPLEFTFLFLAPYLYYGFHIWMAGIGFMLADILGSHVALTFSGGIFDFVLFGILPDATGQGVNSFWIVLLGLIYMPIYYLVFYYTITKMDLKTPGRTGDEEINMISKTEFNEAKEARKVKKSSKVDPVRTQLLIKHIGGLENLDGIADACITRLRITVFDREKVNDKGLTDMGAAAVVGKGKSIQIIFGWEADVFKNEIRKLRINIQ